MLLVAITAIIALMPAVASAQDNQSSGGQRAACRGNAATITAPPGANGAVIIGTPGDDVIVGTPGNDRILGMGGNDIICGLGGDDVIFGGPGHDVILGGDGDDTLVGGPGRDRLFGGRGNDILRNRGNGMVHGGPGQDSCQPGRARTRGCGGGQASGNTNDGARVEPSAVDAPRVPGERSDTPDIPVAPRGVDARVVGACRTITNPAYPGENPWYSGGTFCSVEISSTQRAPRLPGSDENVTVGFLCNAANPSIEDLKNPFACQLSTGGPGISGIEDLSPRDRPGPVSGIVDYVRTGHRYCVHAGSVTYYDYDDATGSSRWLPNTDVVGPRCFSLSGAGVLIWD
jgi:hypothetical protein